MNKQFEVLQSQYKIEKDVKNDALLSTLSDKYCRLLLETTMDKLKSEDLILMALMLASLQVFCHVWSGFITQTIFVVYQK